MAALRSGRRGSLCATDQRGTLRRMAVAPPAKRPNRNVQVNARLSVEQDEILGKLAEIIVGGSRSAAIAHLIDVHAGKEIERAEQREQLLAVAPVEVTRWKKPSISREVIAYVAGLVRAGNLVETACDYAGITPTQRSAWLKRGRNDQRADRGSLYADFVAAVARADAESEVERVAMIQRAGPDQWRAIGYLLERQKPDRYGERKRIDGKVQHTLNPLIDYDLLTAAETRTLVELLRKASPGSDDPLVGRAARPAIELVPDDVIDAVDGEWTEAPALEEPREIEASVEAPVPEAPALGDDSEAPALEKPQR